MRRTGIAIGMCVALGLPAAAGAGEGVAARQFGLPALPRTDFNRLARQAGLPLFWVADDRAPGTIEPAELAVLGTAPDRAAWVKGDAFTPRFEAAWKDLVEARRREAVRRELDQGVPTLLGNDLSGLPAPEKEFVRRMARVAAMVDALHLRQLGAAGFADRIAKADPESRALFERNAGPWCVAAATENDPFCNALPDFPARRWDAYPPGETHDSALCAKLSARPDRADLLAPFAVVRAAGDGYAAVPLTKAYGPEMTAIARELRVAADAARASGQAGMEAYLRAAAGGFETNDWGPADEAWSRMNASNSTWYLRVGPDEVGWDLCQEKAGFHLALARIDRGSLELQAKLTPLRDEMERSLAALIGAPYAARAVSFQMPDFIEVVLNAGDSRAPLGGVLGQSLPNWGKVATEGRGRTVVMTNLYQDPDSRRVARIKAGLLLAPATLAWFGEDRQVELVDVILHEAAHNLGPCSDYRIDGKGPADVFGGRVAGTLEELKAQTAALYYTDLLRRRGVLTDDQAKRLYVHSLVWSFGHLAQGLFAATGNPKTYSQLSAVQIGTMVEAGALSWETLPDPATGRPVGRFEMHFDKVPAAIEALMQRVGRIKATGDVAGAKALLEPYVSGPKAGLVHVDDIIERLRPFPKASFVYSVTL